MTKTAAVWHLEVERGPDWLFVRLCPEEEFQDVDPDLFDRIEHVFESHFVHRLVLEMDEVPKLSGRAIGQLIRLHTRIASRGGLMRLCGLNDLCENALRRRLDGGLRTYETRAEAIRGDRLARPR